MRSMETRAPVMAGRWAAHRLISLLKVSSLSIVPDTVAVAERTLRERSKKGAIVSHEPRRAEGAERMPP